MKSAIRFMALAMALVLAPLARGQALDNIPTGSLVVARVSHIGAVSDKLTAFFQARGIAALLGDAAKPLDAAMTQLGIKQGVDRTGDLAVALVDDGKDSLDGDVMPVVVLVPVTDYQAFVANFPNPGKEDGFDVLPVPGNAAPMFASPRGKYAAGSMIKSLLVPASAPIKLTGATAELVGKSDISLWVDGPAAAKKMRPMLDEIHAMLPQIVSMMPTTNAKMAPIFTAYLGQIFNGIDRFVSDSQTSTLAFSIGADDVRASLMTEFTADTYMARLAGSLKGTDKSLVAGLPAWDYVLAGGLSLESPGLDPWLGDMFNPIEKAAQDCGDDGKKVTDALEGLRAALKQEKSVSFAMLSGTPPELLQIAHGDAAAMKAQYPKTVTASNDLSHALALTTGGQSHITLTPNAKTVGGVSFDAIKTTMDPVDPNSAAAVQQLPGPLGDMVRAAMNPNGTTAYVGQIDNDRLLTETNIPDDTLATLVQSLQANGASLSDDKAIAAAAATLPKSRLMELYIRRPGSLQDETPLAIIVSTDATTLRADVEIPGPMATDIVQGVMNLMQSLPGAGNAGPGAPQGNQPPPPMPGGGL